MAVMKCPNPKCKADMAITEDMEMFDEDGENIFNDKDETVLGDLWYCKNCHTQVVAPKGCMEE